MTRPFSETDFGFTFSPNLRFPFRPTSSNFLKTSFAKKSVILREPEISC